MATDRELIEQIAAGSTEAFGQLYDRYAPRVLGYIVHIAGSRVDAEDVLQDVFWRIWSESERYDSTRSSVPVWIFLQVRSRAIDALRRNGRRATVHQQVGENGHAGHGQVPPDGSRDDDPATAALNQLPVEQRDPIRLSFFRGLSHTQIATHLALPVGTVKTRIRAGMQHLRQVGLQGMNGLDAS